MEMEMGTESHFPQNMTDLYPQGSASAKGRRG